MRVPCSLQRRASPIRQTSYAQLFLRSLHASTTIHFKQLPPRIKIDEKDLTENFIRGGGKGGQKINKTSSKVQLIHHPTGIQVNCQEQRSRAQNRTIARRLLSERIEEQLKGDESRTAIKAAAKQKKAASSMKKKRRKYRKLAEERAEEENTSSAFSEEEGEQENHEESNERSKHSTEGSFKPEDKI